MSSARTAWIRRSATMRSTSSPMPWPCRSLIGLKPSRSMYITASVCRCDRSSDRTWSSRSRKELRLGKVVSGSCRARWRASRSPACEPCSCARIRASAACVSNSSCLETLRAARPPAAGSACSCSSAATHSSTWMRVSEVSAAGSSTLRCSRSLTARSSTFQSSWEHRPALAGAVARQLPTAAAAA